MAVRFDAVTDGYTATNGMPTTAWTFAAWVYLSVDRNDFTPVMQLVQTGGGGGVWLGTAVDGTSMEIQTNGGAVGSFAMTVGTWYRIAAVISGTTATRWAGTDTGSLAASGGTLGDIPGTYTTLRVGNEEFGQFLNGRLAAVKMWDAALSQAELDAEFASWDAVRTANLLRNHYLQVAETTDYSGNGNTLTAGGTTPGTEADPPLGAGKSPELRQPYTARRRAANW